MTSGCTPRRCSSSEVEDAIYTHPAVAEAAVIGLPDDKWGEVVTACITCRADHQVSEGELIAHCKQRLAAYKCPKSVRFLSDLPKSATGKILKQVLREQMASRSGS